MIVCDEIGKYFLMKEASIGVPDVYLGGKVQKVKLVSGRSVGLSARHSMLLRLAETFETI